jgi:hypothetical protein
MRKLSVNIMQMAWLRVHSEFTDLVSIGGAEGIRTPDPLLAKQVLSRLSYSPIRPIWFPVLTKTIRRYGIQPVILVQLLSEANDVE